MKIEKYKTFLINLFNCEKIPVCLFHGDEKIAQNPMTVPYFMNVVEPYYKSLLERDKDITYLTTKRDAVFALIRNRKDDVRIVLGPYFTMPLTKETIQDLIVQLNIPPEQRNNARLYLSNLEYGTLHQFLSAIACLHFAINREVVSVDEIDYDSTFNDLNDHLVRKTYLRSRYESNDENNRLLHTTYLSELQHMDMIAAGNVNGLEHLAIPVTGRQGKLAKTSLRQAKNNLIASATLYSRAAIVGGVSIEDAYNLCDAYIQRSEEATNVVDVERLQRRLPIAFAERVERDARFKDVSQPIMEAIHYIRKNTHQQLNAEILAQQAGLSTTYFLKRFKEETGYGISDFISNCRIEEACLLLSYTDWSLSEISTHLCFSSQSYFQNVFKKAVGTTPGQFRNRQQIPVIWRILKDNETSLEND